jgi:hypothetical protein
MARARTPLAKAEATGRTIINPARFRDRKEHASQPLGEPSVEIGPAEAECWARFKAELPWLTEADRTVVECACVLRAKLLFGEDGIQVKEIAQLRICLNEMGATPASRSKVAVPKDGKEDPADKYIN